MPTAELEPCQIQKRRPQPHDYASRLGYYGQKAPNTGPRTMLLSARRLHPAYGYVRAEEKLPISAHWRCGDAGYLALPISIILGLLASKTPSR